MADSVNTTACQNQTCLIASVDVSGAGLGSEPASTQTTSTRVP